MGEMVSKLSVMATKINSPLGHFAAFGPAGPGFVEFDRKIGSLGLAERQAFLVEPTRVFTWCWSASKILCSPQIGLTRQGSDKKKHRATD